MNVESLKSELQQVLDNDVVLRKEFNELKRSLSDYRNQLIMRDEDCKRLQVTIDVLNTKLAVMERDNTNYKAELTSFKELRGTIKEQLQAKQEEIDTRLNEIQNLRDEVSSIAAGYEAQIEALKNEALAETDRLKNEHANQLTELKTNTHYKESGLREEFENRVAELSVSWADKEQSLVLNYEEHITSLKESHADEVSSLKRDYDSQISNLFSGSEAEVESLRNSYQSTISQMEDGFNHKAETLDASHKTEIADLRSELENQKTVLTAEFTAQTEVLNAEFAAKESAIIAGYEKHISDIQQLASSNTEELTFNFQTQISELKTFHEVIMNETVSGYESKIATLISEYDEKLSNTLIHSTTQTSKLGDELSKFEMENGVLTSKVEALTLDLTSRTEEVSSLSSQIVTFEALLKSETERFLNITGEFELFKQNALLSSSEQVNELNQQISSLNLSHSDYANELSLQIEQLNSERSLLTSNLESVTATLGETELSLESNVKALADATAQIESLNALIINKEQELETFKVELQLSVQQEFNNKEVEFQKLLVENTSIISEIDQAQDKIEAQEAELVLLKTELQELKIVSSGKVEDFKETLSAKNFEITNLEANNAALSQELVQLKEEITSLQGQIIDSVQSGEQLAALQHNFDLLTGEKNSLLAEIGLMQATISGLNESVSGLNEQIASYENQIETLRNETKIEEQEAFIDRLFKQIDGLNDERMVLLDEKDQMASQLLKMNDVIGSISQQVDSERIDVKDLNNHRMNVILASNSDGANEKPRMKEQINDLVREIDKCIALLSA